MLFTERHKFKLQERVKKLVWVDGLLMWLGRERMVAGSILAKIISFSLCCGAFLLGANDG